MSKARQACVTLSLICSLFCTYPIAAEITPVGDEFIVNTQLAGDQLDPVVAMASSGEFVVVWWNYTFPPAVPFAMTGQRFAANGAFLGGEFQIGTANGNPYARVAMDLAGSFLVAWEDSGIQARRFAANGAPIGLEFQVNTYTTGQQSHPDVAMAPDGGFVIVWQSDVTEYQNGLPTGVSRSLRYRRFLSDASPVSDDVSILAADGSPQRPRIGFDGAGEFIIVWQDGVNPAGQRFAAEGAAIGVPFQLGWDPQDMDVAADGSFVVAFEDRHQSYSANGIPVGDAVSFSGTPLISYFPAVDVEPGGDFAVVWQAETASLDQVFLQNFEPDSTPSREVVLVGNTAFPFGDPPDVARNSIGHTVVVWEGGYSGPPGSGLSDTTILGRRYQAPNSLSIFNTGFESGGLDTWSESLP